MSKTLHLLIVCREQKYQQMLAWFEYSVLLIKWVFLQSDMGYASMASTKTYFYFYTTVLLSDKPAPWTSRISADQALPLEAQFMKIASFTSGNDNNTLNLSLDAPRSFQWHRSKFSVGRQSTIPISVGYNVCQKDRYMNTVEHDPTVANDGAGKN